MIRSFFAVLTIYAYLALFHVVPGIDFRVIVATAQAVHNATCSHCDSVTATTISTEEETK